MSTLLCQPMMVVMWYDGLMVALVLGVDDLVLEMEVDLLPYEDIAEVLQCVAEML